MKYAVTFDKFYITSPLDRCSTWVKFCDDGADIKRLIEEQTDRYKVYPEFFIVVKRIEKHEQPRRTN